VQVGHQQGGHLSQQDLPSLRVAHLALLGSNRKTAVFQKGVRADDNLEA